MPKKTILATNDNDGPKVFSPGCQVLPNIGQEHKTVLKKLTLELDEWPHLSAQALDRYEEEIKAEANWAGAGVLDLLEHPSHKMSYPFPGQESKFLGGFDVSVGARAFTFYPKQICPPALLRRLQKRCKQVLGLGVSDDMRESMPQHVCIHPGGLSLDFDGHLSQHTHYFFPSGATITAAQVASIVLKAADLNIIYPPRFPPSEEGQGTRVILTRNARATKQDITTYAERVTRSIIIK